MGRSMKARRLTAEGSRRYGRGTPTRRTGSPPLPPHAPAPPLQGRPLEALVPAPLAVGAPTAETRDKVECLNAAVRETEAEMGRHAKTITRTAKKGQRTGTETKTQKTSKKLINIHIHKTKRIPILLLLLHFQIAVCLNTMRTTVTLTVRLQILTGHLLRVPSHPPFILASILTHRTPTIPFLHL